MGWETRRIGTNTVITYTPSGGSAITLSSDHTTFSPSRTVDTVDVTAGNETERAQKATIESLEWSLTLFDNSGNLVNAPKLLPRSTGVMNVKPDGVGVGLEEYEFNTLLTGYDIDDPFDGAIEISLSGVRNGAMIKEYGTLQT